MKLWLDDIRNPSDYGHEGWVWAKTADEAITLLSREKISKASLDHDLTETQMVKGGFLGRIFDDGEKSGYDVCVWLIRNPQYWPVEGIDIHTGNLAGRLRMEEVLSKHEA